MNTKQAQQVNTYNLKEEQPRGDVDHALWVLSECVSNYRVTLTHKNDTIAAQAARIQELEAQIPDQARLLEFGRLYASYPNENVMTLWEMAGKS